MFKRVRLAVAMAALTSVTAMVSGPVGVVQADVDAADYVVWRWSGPGPRGIGAIQDGTSNTVMTVELLGLKRDTEYRVVASSAPCGTRHRSANRIAGTKVESNAEGASFTTRSFTGGARVGIRSVRLFRGSKQVDCGAALPYQIGGNSGGGVPVETLSLNIIAGQSGVWGMIVVGSGNGGGLLNFAVHGFEDSFTYRMTGSDVQCPDRPSAGKRLFRHGFRSSARGTRYRHRANGGVLSELPSSVHLFQVGAGRVACADSTILVPVT